MSCKQWKFRADSGKSVLTLNPTYVHFSLSKVRAPGSNFACMNTLGVHPLSGTLAIKKPPGIMENCNVYFPHKMCLLICQFQSGKKQNMFSKKEGARQRIVA